MGQSWYYSRGMQQIGPVSSEDLTQLIRSRQVEPGAMVWTEGMPQWQPLQEVPALAALFSPRAPFSAPAPPSIPVAGGWQPQAYPQQVLSYQSLSQERANYAGFWLRFAAYLIDWLITAVGAIIGGFVVGFTVVAVGGDGDVAGPLANVLGMVIGWLYYALMESSSKQATLGKMAVGIRVTDLGGQRIGFGKATGRYFGMIISTLIFCVGFMMAGWTQRKQALHDIMAGCLVVKGKA